MLSLHIMHIALKIWIIILYNLKKKSRKQIKKEKKFKGKSTKLISGKDNTKPWNKIRHRGQKKLLKEVLSNGHQLSRVRIGCD